MAQEFALELLLIGDERLKARDFIDRFKLAVVSADPPRWVSKMYPDLSQSKDEVEVVEDPDDLDLEETEGEWRFTEEVDPEEAERLLAEVLAQAGGTLTMDDLDEDEGWE